MKGRAAAYLRAWDLSEPAPVADTQTSEVYRVRLADGGPAVLKVLKPFPGQDERRAGVLLDWYAGQGSVQVYRHDEGAHLVEDLPGGPLSDVVRAGRDDRATEVICDVVARLHAPRGADLPKLDPLEAWIDGLGRARSDPLFGQLRDLARRLLASTERVVPLHGDLHHDNILHGVRGWLAIDPKGMIGDPAFDVSNTFRNPHGLMEVTDDPERMRRLVARYEQRLGLLRDRVLGWTAVYAGLSASWDLMDGLDPAHSIAAAKRALAVLGEG